MLTIVYPARHVAQCLLRSALLLGNPTLPAKPPRAIAAAAPAPNTLTAAERRQGWRLLFDGKTAAGWRSIHEKLIERAKERLSTSALSVGEIAYELGFEHVQSFSRLFKAKTQHSPLEFRQLFKN